MAIEFKLPELGENIASGDIVKILVHEGDPVKPNQGVFELETDKAVIEVPCSTAGTVTKIHIKEGDKVKVGQVLLTLEETVGQAPPDKKAAAGQAPPDNEPPTNQGTTADSSSSADTETKVEPQGPTPSRSGLGLSDTGSIPAGPVARRLARELGVDLTRVSGSGPHGRILPEDVQRATAAGQGTSTTNVEQARRLTPGATAGSSSSVDLGAKASKPSMAPESRDPVIPPGREDHDAWGPVRRDRMPQIRQTIARHMSHSANTIPHVTNFDDADVTELDAVRKSVPVGWLAPGIKLTMMPLVLKAVAMALRQHPLLNASLDEENGEIVYKQYVNIGVAVDTPRGLVVPALRGVDRMSIAEIAEAVGHLAQQARDASFAIEDLRGGTFTVSNLGAVGGVYSTPIINHPESAILLLGRSRWMPVARDGQVQIRLMMPLSLSYDHRLVDGGTAGRFLNQVIDSLQSPGKLVF